MKIVQITDMHLCKDPEKLHWNMNTTHTFKEALSHALRNEKPDLILLTGDLSEDASLASYQRLAEIIDSTGINTYCIPGNHDHLETMNEVFSSQFIHMKNNLAVQNWEIIFINTVVENKHHGMISEENLALLDQQLSNASAQNIMLALHHNPVAVDSSILDKYWLMNSEEFLNVLKKYPKVKIALYGHVHQDHSKFLNGTLFLSCPSTCVQFLHKASTFTLDKLPPGYRWLQLENDGSFSTGVRYI